MENNKSYFFKEVPVFQYSYDGEYTPYDPDASPLAWNHYKRVYTYDDKWHLVKAFNFEELEPYGACDLKKGYYVRLIAKLKPDSELLDNLKFAQYFELSGETDFNFGEAKVTYFAGVIGNNPERLAQLKRCGDTSHTLVNYSIMARTGSMQLAKGRVPGDRLDTFIYNLENYYSTSSKDRDKADIVNGGRKDAKKSRECLINFLNTFEDGCKNSFEKVCNYCEKIYFISDKELVEDLISNGKKDLNDINNVFQYMDLAERFWKCKIERYNEVYSSIKSN